MLMRRNSGFTRVIRIARPTVSTMFRTAGRRVSGPLEHSSNEETSSFIRSIAQRISWYRSFLCISLIPDWVRNSAFARMALKGWRRSWEMWAILLLTAQKGSGTGRSSCVLCKDPAGNNRTLDTDWSSMEFLLRVRADIREEQVLFTFGMGMHSLATLKQAR